MRIVKFVQVTLLQVRSFLINAKQKLHPVPLHAWSTRFYLTEGPRPTWPYLVRTESVLYPISTTTGNLCWKRKLLIRFFLISFLWLFQKLVIVNKKLQKCRREFLTFLFDRALSQFHSSVSSVAVFAALTTFLSLPWRLGAIRSLSFHPAAFSVYHDDV